MPKTAIRGQPYAPGLAGGIVTRDCLQAGPDDILLVHQEEIERVRPPLAGLIIVHATPFSHRNIRLIHLGIPIVNLDSETANQLKEGTFFYLDGFSGNIQQHAVTSDLPRPARISAGHTLKTRDGEDIFLRCSVRHAADAKLALEAGAESIGLVRSEFFHPAHNAAPDSEFYHDAFDELLHAASPLAVTIRLLDVAEDKPPPWGDWNAGSCPHLGEQGLRSFHHKPLYEAFTQQLLALKNLASHHQVNVIIPFVTHEAEFCFWRGEVERHLGNKVKIGAMLENPIAALSLQNILKAADFVAMGCNDLMQYLFAADRDDARLSRYLDPYHPALYRFFAMIAGQLGNAGKRLQLCGLLPQLPGVLPVLLGMGFRAFSVEPVLLPYLQTTVLSTLVTGAEQLARSVCGAENPAQVKKLLLA